MRRSVFYTMSQAERRGRLKVSSWPDLDWENEWVCLTTFDEFDRSIAMDARSGKLQEAFNLPYNGPYDVETPRTTTEGRMIIDDIQNEEDAEKYLRQMKQRNSTPLPTQEQIEQWSRSF